MSELWPPGSPGRGAVAVTGGAGFVGSAVVRRAVAAGCDVVAVVRACEVESLPAAAHRVVDWNSAGDLQRALTALNPATVVHCAGVSGRSGESAAAQYQSNVGLTATLLEAVARSCPCAAVVLLSSAAVYGSQAMTPTPETAPLKPETHYAHSKAMTEMLGRAFAEVDGMHVTVARPFNILGPGEPTGSVVSALLGQVLAAPESGTAHVTLRETSSVRDFVDVDDVADALLLIAARGESGRSYNVCTGIGTSVAALADIVARALGRALTVEAAEPGRAGTVSTGSCARLRDLGWSARHSLEASLVRSCSPASARPS